MSMIVVDLLLFGLVSQKSFAPVIALFMSVLDFTLLIILIRVFSQTREPNLLGIALYLFSSLLMVFMFTRLYMLDGINDVSSVQPMPTKKFWDCFYFSIVTWTSLGYGDVQPSILSRKWVMIEVSFGYIHMGVLVGLFMDYLKLGIRK